MKQVILEEQIQRIFELMKIESGVIKENVGKNLFSDYFACVTNFPIKIGAQGTIQRGVSTSQQTGVAYAEPKGIKQLEGVSFASTGDVFRYGYQVGNYSCQGPTIVYTVNNQRLTYTPQTTSSNQIQTLKDVVITAPPKFLKNTQGVKDFQDWLDTNKKGWLKGKELNKKGGYGSYGPNTQKAWTTHKDEYMKYKSQSSTTTSSVAAQSSTPNQQTTTQSSGNLMQHKIYNPENEQ